ncbi:MAG: DUF4270 domain-containing protein [Dysgonamonadaceae bacterium]|nr:DUF4270 domain-containing protein [Dysgonamonadaceae bacterium]MDD4727665.1 DUF4270 domain-containing protein [Dysgonamonadaceae bacterium]
MKQIKPYSIFILVLIALIYSCDDSLKNLGFTIQPESDRITVGTDTLFLKARTISVDSLLPDGMFAKTKSPVLGEYKDPLFGSIKSDYVGEFYYPEGAQFPKGAIIDSVEVGVFYDTWQGDSLAPIELSVYEINKSLPISSHYTNFDPTEYVDMSSPIGKSIFSAANIEVPVSEREDPEYYHRAIAKLPKSIGEKILNVTDTVKNLDTDTFKKYFKGLYVTTEFGSGTIVTVDHTYLFIHFHYLDVKGSSTKTDTIRAGSLTLNTTPEVTQINQIKSNNDKLLEENDEYVFVKSPAGVYTEIVFPFSEKADKLNNQALNLAKLTLTTLPEKNSNLKFKLRPSPYMLLVNKDDLKEFFEKRKVPDNVTSFYAQLDGTTYSYNFGNLSAMINHYKKENDGKVKDLTYVLVPISMNISNISNQTTVTAIYNQMTPSATTIFKTHDKMRMEMIFSKL